MFGNTANIFAIYSRKSKYTGIGDSVENQIEMCRQYIDANLSHGNSNGEDAIHFTPEDVIETYEDEGFSGKNTKRPEFQRLLKDVRAGKIKAVVCYRLDRISRNVGDFANLSNEFKKYNVAFISTSDKFDTSTPAGKAMMLMVSVFSQMERELAAERITDNMLELAKSGRWLGGTTPTGYKSEELKSFDINGKERKQFKLEVIPEEFKIVKLIYTKYIELNSLTQLETYLLNQHIKTKNGVEYSRFSIRCILTNPVYMCADKDAWNYFEQNGFRIFAEENQFNGKCGVMTYNKTCQNNGKSHEMKDISKWIVAVGKHKPAVSGAMWVKVQKMLEINKPKSYYRKSTSSFGLLSGLLYCKDCGSFMRPKTNKAVLENGERSFSYICERKDKSRREQCNSRNANGNQLDREIINAIKELSEDTSYFMRQLGKLKSTLKKDNLPLDTESDMLNHKFRENEKQIENFLNSLGETSQTKAGKRITDRINALEAENETIQQQLADLNYTRQINELDTNPFDLLMDMTKSFAVTVDHMTFEQKKNYLRLLVRKVVWDGEDAHLYLTGTDDDVDMDLEGLSSTPKRGDCKCTAYHARTREGNGGNQESVKIRRTSVCPDIYSRRGRRVPAAYQNHGTNRI